MSDVEMRWSSRLPWILLAFIVVATATGDGLLMLHVMQSPAAPAYDTWLEATVNALSFGAVGAVVARHRPRNAVGWLILGIGCASATQVLTGEYAMYGHHVLNDRLVGVSAVAWLSAVCVLTALAALPAMILLFPDGRLVSPRWRPVLLLTIAAGALFVFVLGVEGGTLGNTEGIENPFGFLPAASGQVLEIAPAVGLLVCLLAALASLAVRWRRSGPDGRQQLKWVVFAGVGGPASILVLTLLFPHIVSGGFGNLLWAIGVGAIPVAAGVSILRYRLYDIDRLISRTFSYSLLTGLLIGVYVLLVAGVTRLLPVSSSQAVAVATLAVAALFQPLRRRLQAAVDRRFNRARYDADRTVAAFTARLRDEVDLDAVRHDLIAVVHDTLQPASAGLWLRPGKESL